MKRPRINTCHPERKHAAKGLCHPCYEKQRYNTIEEVRAHWAAYGRKRRAEKPREIASDKLRASYGIEVSDWEELYNAQEGKCAICGEFRGKICQGLDRTKVLHVDHDHETGRIRGLLCNTCNRALGLFKDDPEVLLSALRYLVRNSR